MRRGRFHGLRFQRRIRVLHRRTRQSQPERYRRVRRSAWPACRRDGARAALRQRGPARYGFERATIQPGEQFSEA
jgi:hypothetical protein